MYDVIYNIINHVYDSGDRGEQYIYCICGALIIIFTITFVDLLYRVFRHLWRF